MDEENRAGPESNISASLPHIKKPLLSPSSLQNPMAVNPTGDESRGPGGFTSRPPQDLPIRGKWSIGMGGGRVNPRRPSPVNNVARRPSSVQGCQAPPSQVGGCSISHPEGPFFSPMHPPFLFPRLPAPSPALLLNFQLCPDTSRPTPRTSKNIFVAPSQTLSGTEPRGVVTF